MMKKHRIIRIYQRLTGELIAEGPSGWGITSFEGNYYIRKKYIKTRSFKLSYIPGLCPYKFFYVWLHYDLKDGNIDKMLAWLYFIPNPLLPFIWFRIAVPQRHPSLKIEMVEIEKN